MGTKYASTMTKKLNREKNNEIIIILKRK